MATEADLIAQVKSLANIQGSEGFAPDDLSAYLRQALRQHNQNVTAATLSVAEEEPVVTLLWIKVCLVRASRYAEEANLTGAAGYGQDRNTPYNKCIALAKFLQARYIELCGDLGLTSAKAGGITVGNLVVKDLTFDELVPLLSNPFIPPLYLALAEVNEAGSWAVINWKFDNFDNFARFDVFHLTGDAPIFQEWNNVSSSGVPKVNDNATKVICIWDWRDTALKLAGIDFTLNNRILMVVRSRSGNYGYSNELLLTVIPKGGLIGAEGDALIGAEGSPIETVTP